MPTKTEIEMGLYRMAGEPYFVLMARDPDFAPLIQMWVNRREADIRCGNRPGTDIEQVTNAKVILATGAAWRLKNNGAWRKVPPDVVTPPSPPPGRPIEADTNPPSDDAKDAGPGPEIMGGGGGGIAGAILGAGVDNSKPLHSIANCNMGLKRSQLPMPRTCQICGLGPCNYGWMFTITTDKNTVMRDSSPLPERPIVPGNVYRATREAVWAVSPFIKISTLLAFAYVLSKFNPKFKTSISAGLYGFEHYKWVEAVGNFGSKYKVTDGMLFNMLGSSTMMACLLQQYEGYLKIHNIVANVGNLYCLHVLGMSSGVKLIKCAHNESDAYTSTTLAKVAFPVMAIRDPSLFEHSTIEEVYISLTKEITALEIEYSTHSVMIDETLSTIDEC